MRTPEILCIRRPLQHTKKKKETDCPLWSPPNRPYVHYVFLFSLLFFFIFPRHEHTGKWRCRRALRKKRIPISQTQHSTVANRACEKKMKVASLHTAATRPDLGPGPAAAAPPSGPAAHQSTCRGKTRKKMRSAASTFSQKPAHRSRAETKKCEQSSRVSGRNTKGKTVPGLSKQGPRLVGNYYTQ